MIPRQLFQIAIDQTDFLADLPRPSLANDQIVDAKASYYATLAAEIAEIEASAELIKATSSMLARRAWTFLDYEPIDDYAPAGCDYDVYHNAN